MINKMKRQPVWQKKVSANHISEKGLIFNMYRELLKLDSKKANDDLKMGKGPEWASLVAQW